MARKASGVSSGRRRFFDASLGAGTGLMLGGFAAGDLAAAAKASPAAGFDDITLLERARILDQVARYSWAFDSGDLAEYLARFWPDGVLEHPKADGSPGSFAGHEGIRAFTRGFEGRRQQTWGHQHQFSAIVMDRVSPQQVQLRAYACVFRHEFHRTYWPHGASFRMGTWHALFENRQDDWKIRLLQVKMWTDTSIGETGMDLIDRPPHSPGTR